MNATDLIVSNLLSPIVLAFLIGAVAGFVRSELELPESILKFLSIYLLFSIGIVGGRELSRVTFSAVSDLLLISFLLTLAIPVVCYAVMRRLGGFDIANAAAIAAHYGSVSTATFFASVTFAAAMGTPSEAYMTAVVAIMEFAVIWSLLIARWAMGREAGGIHVGELLLSALRGRGILLLTGGMIVGATASETQWTQIAPFYSELFRGMLMIFLLEMGMTAARQVRAFAKVGVFMGGFAIVMPVIFGSVGVVLGHAIGLSQGGAFVLGAVAASASFIDAPAACRASLPTANPGIYLTASIAVTLPFNLLVGIPLYYQIGQWLYAV